MFNQTILLGRLGQDAELRYSPDGQAVLKFSLATSEKWKNKDGEPKEKTTWHKCVTFGKRAENLAEFMLKGTLALVIGSTKMNLWEDKEGVKRTSSSVVVSTIKLVSKKSENPADAGDEIPSDIDSEEDSYPDDSDSDPT